jgi:hypothetical protein
MENSRRPCSDLAGHCHKPHYLIQTIASLILTASLISPALACAEGKVQDGFDAALPDKPSQSIDVVEPISVEGGLFEIYNTKAGVPQSIVRTDFGETYRQENRFFFVSGKIFGFKVTRFEYASPIYTSGSKVVREVIDYYEVCDGKLEVPKSDEATGDIAEYRKAAIAVYTETILAPELAKIIPALKLTPPPWQ